MKPDLTYYHNSSLLYFLSYTSFFISHTFLKKNPSELSKPKPKKTKKFIVFPKKNFLYFRTDAD